MPWWSVDEYIFIIYLIVLSKNYWSINCVFNLLHVSPKWSDTFCFQIYTSFCRICLALGDKFSISCYFLLFVIFNILLLKCCDAILFDETKFCTKNHFKLFSSKNYFNKRNSISWKNFEIAVKVQILHNRSVHLNFFL